MHQITQAKIINKQSSSLLLEEDQSITLKYMTIFCCIGSDCEDNCCKQWEIPVDETHYKMLEKHMNATKADRDKFHASIECNKNSENPEQYATLKHSPDGKCSFLCNDGLCAVHKDYGELALFNSCTFYPRSINVIGNRYELSATLSCPEIARRCLLVNDATELVKLDLETLPRKIQKQNPPPLPVYDQYIRHINAVRYTVFKLLSFQQYSIYVCLFFSVYFANRISSFFYENTTNFFKEKLIEEMLRIENPTLLNELHKKYNEIVVSNTFSMAIIQSFLVLRIKDSLNNELDQMILDCLKTYNEVGDLADSVPGKPDITCERLWEAYEKRCSYWESAYRDRTDIYLRNYCRNKWIKDLYVHKPDLMTYFGMQLLQFCIIRFLFYSHPELNNIQKKWNGTTVEEDIATNTLDKIIVRVISLFAKHVEHNSKLVEDLQKILDELEIKSFASLMFLLKF
ncbi:MAG: flagellin lysine-N-methylase [Candidatus Brocadiales bacterium]|nr:flagellin lysine-N-methylase [Candidatus Brocadiales bacterium]